MVRLVDITGDVATDVETRRAFPIYITAPPEEEGYTCGVYFAGEEGSDGYAESDAPTIATLIVLGPGDWTNGKVNLSEFTTVNEAIRLINEALIIDSTDIPLGDEIASDGSSLWDDGAIGLTPDMSVGEAISGINKFLTEGGGGAADGNHLPLGEPDDGSFADGAVALDPAMMVTEGIDRMNEVLGKLVPAQPPAFPNGTALSITNASGNTPRLATGVTDNSHDGTLSAGDAVTRLAATTITTNTFNDIGPGDTGSFYVIMDGSVVLFRDLTGNDNGNYSGLIISDQKGYPPATPDFWKSFDVQVNGLFAPDGINSLTFQHTGAGSTGTIYFVRDNLNNAPVISSASVVEAVAGTLAYSSSVPHYGSGAQLTVNASYNNLAGETYYGGSDPFTISGSNGIIATVAKSYANIGITTPIARQTTGAQAITAQTINIDGSNVHNSGLIQGVAKNVAGSSATTNLSSKTVLVKRGSAGSRVDENSIPVSGLGSLPNANNAVRVSLGNGDRPAGAAAPWDSSAALPVWEAAVVAGVIRHEQTDYSNHLPPGPNLSVGRSGAQYLTFSFNRSSQSAFKLNVTGNYAGCFIKLPGVSDAQPNGGGWWDGFQPYDGAGIPGETGDALAGCALGSVMSGSSGTFQITFGAASSTFATDNQILVRFKLNAGQTISNVGVTG